MADAKTAHENWVLIVWDDYGFMEWVSEVGCEIELDFSETRTVPVLNFMRFNFLVRQIHLNMVRLN